MLTTTGMLAAVVLPDLTTQAQPVVATESLGPTRHYIKTADICYGKSKFIFLIINKQTNYLFQMVIFF